ncbi:putative small integral membrane protein [Streptomyces sp. V4I23]|nr:putative small integral membrane protein [Streptomyces sp. V4I23]
MADGTTRGGGLVDRLLQLGTAPVAATVLTGTMAVYMTLVVFGNITDFGTNQQFVQHVLAMDTTFKDPQLMWRAIESPALQNAAYVAIIAWETLAAAVLLLATWLWAAGLRHRAHDRARRASTVGLVMVLLLFGLGFIAIGGEWFAMWQSSDWNGLDAAARNVTAAAFALVVVHLPSVRGGGN